MSKTQLEKISKVEICRACKGTSFKKWVDLGKQPLANNLLKDPQDPEELFPLAYMYCVDCELVQLAHVVNPDLLFTDYLYHSSTSKVFTGHFTALAEKEFAMDRIKYGDLVVDIGSNDGILLKPFKDRGAKVVGVEPARKIADEAIAKGIPTIKEYFDEWIAGTIRNGEDQEAKLITMTNAFAHVPDLDKIMQGVKFLLADDGRFMLEVAYLPDMLKYSTFDLLYHEHVCSWHLFPMQKFFERHEMVIDEVNYIPVHGGSIRVYVKNKSAKNTYTTRWAKNEMDLISSDVFRNFPKKIEKRREDIKTLLTKLKGKNKRIIGYGAPAKMTVMTNFFDIGPETIDFIIDDAPAKHGLYSPGKHIKIVPLRADLSNCTHDYMFIFAWNFAPSIMAIAKSAGYKGHFIVPFPALQII